MAFVVPQTEPIGLKAVAAIKLNRHPIPFLLEVSVQDVGIQHSTQDQRVNDLSLWFELGVDLLNRWDVVLNDVVAYENLSVFKDLQPLLWILKQLRLVPLVDGTTVNRSHIPGPQGIRLHIERYRRGRT